MTTLSFAVYCDEKSHLVIAAEVREYEPTHRVWCVAGTCQRWRGAYLSQGQYLREMALSGPFVVVARAASIEEALRMLSETALTQARGGDDL